MKTKRPYTTLIAGLLLLIRPLTPPVAAVAPETASVTQYAAATASAFEEPSFSEYDVKAGFIYRFISFVSWPEQQPDDGTITIGILGKNPFGNAFKSVEGSTVGNRVVTLKYISGDTDIEKLKTCQILYISSSLEKRLQDILKTIGESPTLTVGDSKGFIDKGGMVGFVRRDKERIGIEINVAAADRAGLTIRSMLKRLAVRIINDKDRTMEQ